MNITRLNYSTLKDDVVIKSASSGGIQINNQSKSVEITENGRTSVTHDADYTGLSKVDISVNVPPKNQDKSVDIVENGILEVVADSGFTGLGSVSVNVNVPSSGGGETPSRPKWTGHADAEGLRAIGWTDEDIAYYQANGVNWNEEDDEYHKVTDDNKALYGVLTVDNIQTYKDRIVYLPKIDTSERTSMSSMFQTCYALISIPMLDTSNATDFSSMFKNCYSLVCVLPFDTSNAATFNSMFYGCRTLTHVPLFNSEQVANTASMYYGCFSLSDFPALDLGNVKNADAMFYNCYSAVTIPHLNIEENIPDMTGYSANNIFYNCYALTKVSMRCEGGSINNPFYNCYSLSILYIDGLVDSWQISNSPLLNKNSLLFMINNSRATSSIKLHSYAYTRLANDADILAALANHPNISISK